MALTRRCVPSGMSPSMRSLSSLPRLKLLMAGIRRVRARNPMRPTRVRLPITLAALSAMKQLWERSITHDILMMWAAATVCFFGFLRSGEITVPLFSVFDPAVHLTWGDVAFDNPTHHTSVRIELKDLSVTKLGQERTYISDALARRFAPSRQYWHILPPVRVPQVHFQGFSRPTIDKVILRQGGTYVRQLGFQADQFSGHSFRIGAATAAAQAGVEDSAIQALGRWSSAAFLLYIRTPREQLAWLTTRIANPPPPPPPPQTSQQ